MFLKLGMRGPEVTQAQIPLHKLGFYQDKIDDIFGPNMLEAVIEFQKSVGLNADGVIGPKTWAKLGVPKPEPKPVFGVPSGRAAVEEMFGDPLQSGWAKEMLAFCEVPDELAHCFRYKHKKTGKHGFYCHKLMIPHFQKVYQGIVNAKLGHLLETFEGCWNVRKIRGGENLSMHSYGIAVDHNAKTNALGAQPQMDDRIVAIFENVGFVWGGHFKRKDGMHFQWARNA